jgi:prepilin-type N-terminal cleavage/methylation domain-containing protein
MNHRPTARRQAFTLIELLTVIAIVGVLAALIVPVVGRARESARKSLSISNLRQWGNALHLHLGDNRGIMPGRGPAQTPTWSEVAQAGAAGAWFNALPPYASAKSLATFAVEDRDTLFRSDNIHRDPSARFGNETTSISRPYFSYALNSQMNVSRAEAGAQTLNGVDQRNVSLPFTRYPDPAQTVYLFETQSNLDPGQTTVTDSNSGRAYGRSSHLSYRYNRRPSILFLDGSVRTFARGDIDTGNTANENNVVFFAAFP